MIRGLVLIHGRGGSGRDMRGLIGPLGAEGMEIATPEAPGNSWWPTSFLAPAAQMAGPLDAGLAAVDEAARSLGLPRDAVALVGFSQGACLALEYAARRGAGLGAVIALSGGLVGQGDEGDPTDALYGHCDKAFDYDADLTGLRALITCHEADPHIPLARAITSEAVLDRLGATARLIMHPGPGHQPMQDGIVAAREILHAA
ncbi:alpha/beta hydrolase [Jannaschia sp. 2305UL9-9]|uniref:alpha/beta hydrolase n=1 Tax=Jannaschia sp. 2305UL9-9 TaxID=3121638 RepID=UPI00352807C4